MTISSTNRKAGPFIGNGSASVFTFSFRVFAASDLKVVRVATATGVETTLTFNSHYTVTLNANQNSNPGGSVTLTAGPLASGFNLIITSDIANLQPTDLTNQGGFYPEVITSALDRSTIQIQQLDEQLGRSLSYPITDEATGGEIPTKSVRANKFLGFNNDGEPIAELPANVAGWENYQAAAAASASSAAASAAASDASEADALAAKVASESARDTATAQAVISTAQAVAATAAKNAAEAARDAAVGINGVYANTTAGLAATTVGDYFSVPSASEALFILYRVDAGPVATEIMRYASATPFLAPKKNHADPSKILVGKYYSVGSGAVISSGAFRSIGPIPVIAGRTYTISGVQGKMTVGVSTTSSQSSTFTNMGVVGDPSGVGTFVIPAGNSFLWVNLTNTGQSVTTYDGTVQIEEGTVATSYEPYILFVDIEKVTKNSRIALMETVTGTNILNPANVAFDNKRYTVGTKSIITDATLSIAHSGWVPVTEGLTYTISGAYYGSGQGGYFTGYGITTAYDNITFVSATSGSGLSFTVPTGVGITHVVINLNKNGIGSAGTALQGPVQIERGSSVTAYEAYKTKTAVPEAFLPFSVLSQSTVSSTTLNDEAWFKFVEGESQPYNRDRWPVFTQKMLNKTSDVVVVALGTSLTARTTEHNSVHPLAKNRPPLMHSMNSATYMWDAMSRGWEGQKYSRYDDTAVVTEASGTWATSISLAEWDDATARDGLTRYSATNGASVTFAVPAGAWAWRFIHRTDSVASTALQVSISSGNGVAQVWDEGTSAWVEANGYTFSQREATPTTRSVSVPSPDTNVFSSIIIPSKGNTTYQKRLRLRFTNRASSKTVTITNTVNSTRFNYWGCEWSPREFMLTYINAARGAHNTQATSASGLPRFADNEVHGFKPDLIYGELPIHNDGAAGIGVSATWDRWGRLANNYVWRSDYELSLKTRATFFGYTPEFGWWTPTIATNFGGINTTTGELLSSAQADGRVMTALDKFDQAVAWIRANYPNVVMIHAVRRWVEAGFAIYGNMQDATKISSKTGPSMTNDGSHPNDIGSKVLAKLLVGPLDFAP